MISCSFRRCAVVLSSCGFFLPSHPLVLPCDVALLSSESLSHIHIGDLGSADFHLRARQRKSEGTKEEPTVKLHHFTRLLQLKVWCDIPQFFDEGFDVTKTTPMEKHKSFGLQDQRHSQSQAQVARPIRSQLLARGGGSHASTLAAEPSSSFLAAPNARVVEPDSSVHVAVLGITSLLLVCLFPVTGCHS